MPTIDHLYYVGEEIKYGTHLYIAGWKKLVLHPWQTLKDTAYAFSHPIETAKALWHELRQHPIGMTVNFGLSWLTGRTIKMGLKHLRHTSLPAQAKNTIASETFVSSTLSQVIQLGNQMMGGGCCGGICTTTAGRIGQTASLITSQAESSTQYRVSGKKQEQQKAQSYSPYYNSSFMRQKNECTDAGCSVQENPLPRMRSGKLKFIS
ncbi:MAG: hypothetical protein KA508_05125 [Gammaproteobacteria bacterium]|nr:hypothetical protein [Gammaproteobacteria bacterium]